MSTNEKKPTSNEEYMKHLEQKMSAFQKEFNVRDLDFDDDDSDEAVATFVPKARDPKAQSS